MIASPPAPADPGRAFVRQAGSHGIHDADPGPHELIFHALPQLGDLYILERPGERLTKGTHEAHGERSAGRQPTAQRYGRFDPCVEAGQREAFSGEDLRDALDVIEPIAAGYLPTQGIGGQLGRIRHGPAPDPDGLPGARCQLDAGALRDGCG